MNKAYVQDGDVGCGAPGSLSWHKCNLAQLCSDDQKSYIAEMSHEDKLELLIHLVTEKSNDGNLQNTTHSP